MYSILYIFICVDLGGWVCLVVHTYVGGAWVDRGIWGVCVAVSGWVGCWRIRFLLTTLTFLYVWYDVEHIALLCMLSLFLLYSPVHFTGNTAAIIGGAVGGAVAGVLCICLVIGVCIAVCCCCQKKKARNRTAASNTRVNTVQPAAVATVTQTTALDGRHGTKLPDYTPAYNPNMQGGYAPYPATYTVPAPYPPAGGTLPPAYPPMSGGTMPPAYPAPGGALPAGYPPQQPYPA